MSILLVIDSDPDSQESLERICHRNGVKIIAAGNLSDGISLYKQQSVDLVVLDLFLPQKSGFSLIAEITSKESHPPIIATFSADRAPGVNIKRFAHLLGASYTFEKPLNPRLFLQACSELVAHFPAKQD
ncbi:MAG TPA: response regulator [Nitrospirales bacterium]|nr:response regulator [Nitrospirales bacterium]